MLRAQSMCFICISFVCFINPTIVAESKYKAVDASGGEYHTLVLMQDRSLWSCGQGTNGQLGDGTQTDKSTLVQVSGGDMATTYLQSVTDFDAGWYHSLAIALDPSEKAYVLAWGSATYGQLGNGLNTGMEVLPTKVLGGDMGTQYLENIASISAGRSVNK